MSLWIFCIFVIFSAVTTTTSGGSTSSNTSNDLRELKYAARLYYADTGIWLVAGEEASLDRYLDYPLASARWKQRYAAVTIGPKFIYNGEERVNIGVTLISGQNDSPATLKKLASMAERSELLAGPTVMTEYDGKGLGVWMNIR